MNCLRERSVEDLCILGAQAFIRWTRWPRRHQHSEYNSAGKGYGGRKIKTTRFFLSYTAGKVNEVTTRHKTNKQIHLP